MAAEEGGDRMMMSDEEDLVKDGKDPEKKNDIDVVWAQKKGVAVQKHLTDTVPVLPEILGGRGDIGEDHAPAHHWSF